MAASVDPEAFKGDLPMTSQVDLEFRSIGHVYGGGNRHRRPVEALRDVSLSLPAGSLTCIVGESGCGKSTLLRMAAGILRPTSGSVCIAGEEIRSPGRERAFVFQDHNLFPWKTTRQNVEWGAKMMGVPRDRYRSNSERLLAVMGLERFANSLPGELSGGMKQRVGIARALCVEPSWLLMDEPFSALDAHTRERMQTELLRVLEEERRGVLFITHSVDEAILLADRVIVMSPRPGTVLQEVPIDLPRPRSGRLPEVRRDPRWAEYRLRLDDLLNGQGKPLHASRV